MQVFKNSHFPPEIVQGLSVALDDLEDRPLIVRSSSLLEDRLGSAFSGKYKSLFLANQGTKRERLAALLDAIAEVYASIFGPDPIEYRAERGLLDVHEEMGIMIQEVVGTRVGRYFLPAFAGVGFSHNEFRWSPRIRREDGLLRLVPGLGTRAVDRLARRLPGPGRARPARAARQRQPPTRSLRYSPRKVDVINLETRHLRDDRGRATSCASTASELPALRQIALDRRGRHGAPAARPRLDFASRDLVVTFEGLVAEHAVRRAACGRCSRCCASGSGPPVDIEFASDGERPLPAAVPAAERDPGRRAGADPARPARASGSSSPPAATSRTASVPDITHVVYVDPEGYSRLEARRAARRSARAVGRLNKLLPKRQFILMGPGRWGSRGDIQLGVSVTYSDISNTAVLIEIARKKGNYVPDLSFGTHFFQDLVEAAIRYLPLYPDDPG